MICVRTHRNNMATRLQDVAQETDTVSQTTWKASRTKSPATQGVSQIPVIPGGREAHPAWEDRRPDSQQGATGVIYTAGYVELYEESGPSKPFGGDREGGSRIVNVPELSQLGSQSVSLLRLMAQLGVSVRWDRTGHMLQPCANNGVFG